MATSKTLSIYIRFMTVAVLFLCVDRFLALLIDGTSILIPLIIAVFLSILLNPIINFLEKYRVPHILAVVITMLVAVVLIFSIYETMAQSVNAFLNGFSKYSNKIDSLARRLVDLAGISPDVLSGDLKILDDPQAAKIMRESVNLSAVVVLFALLFWGFIWGIPGMFLAVPMTAILKIIFENIDQLKPVAILMSGRVKT